jgi:hypothetical protein
MEQPRKPEREDYEMGHRIKIRIRFYSLAVPIILDDGRLVEFLQMHLREGIVDGSVGFVPDLCWVNRLLETGDAFGKVTDGDRLIGPVSVDEQDDILTPRYTEEAEDIRE